MKTRLAAICLVVFATFLLVTPGGAIRVYLNPSDQTSNTSPDGTYNEAYSMQDVARRIASQLSSRGFEVQNSNGGSLSYACSSANAWPADLFISLHTNAGSGGWGSSHGTMSFYYQSSTGWHNDAGVDIANRCAHKCIDKFGQWGRGYDIGTFADWPYYGYNLYVLKNTNMTSTLVEGLFHDNWDDVQVLKTDAGKDAYADAIYEAVCDFYGWAYNYPSYQPMTVASIVSVVNNADGRLEIFARGNDGACWHNWQKNPNSNWKGWSSLGGGITDVPQTGRNSDGRLEVFARGTDGNLYHRYQDDAGGAWNPNWYNTGIAMGWNTAVGTLSDGRMEIFVRGTNGQVYHQWQNTPSGGWSSWASLGGGITDWPVVATNMNNKLEVFARGTDGKVWHNWYTGTAWSGWYALPNINMGWPPSVARNIDGRLEVFARGTDGAIWHCYQNSSGAWSNWYSFGTGPGGVGFAGCTQAVIANADGRLELFAKGNDNVVYGICQTSAGGGWSAWYNMGGNITHWPAVGKNQDGRLELFARFNDGYIWHKWQQGQAGGSWSGWSKL